MLSSGVRRARTAPPAAASLSTRLLWCFTASRALLPAAGAAARGRSRCRLRLLASGAGVGYVARGFWGRICRLLGALGVALSARGLLGAPAALSGTPSALGACAPRPAFGRSPPPPALSATPSAPRSAALPRRPLLAPPPSTPFAALLFAASAPSLAWLASLAPRAR